ncbi:MAG: nucleoside phosphorylase [Campylobacteraceae bacterium]|nr:nucleoside phosphorylase [Campylobacteraceae bacterium]
MSNHKTLIHTALHPEAKPIIQYFNLLPNKTYEPLKIFENENYILVVAGIGRTQTKNILPFIFDNFKIKKAINIGIAGCKDKSVKLGTLFCVNQTVKDIQTTTITTVDSPLDDVSLLHTTLVDMESEEFLQISKTYLNPKDIYVFKIVSDYLSKNIPDKSFVFNSIKKSIPKWEIVL